MGSKAIAVRAEGLTKLYRLGASEGSQDNLATAFLSFLRSPLANYRMYRSLYDFRDIPSLDVPEEQLHSAHVIRALHDVSFELEQGEALGIIGLNGAGKSTLLKVLARITPPTAGSATLHGRVGSLLEVGTGFHQELTGRENVYLNGTVLGMRKREVDRKFDEIVDFSGVEEFLDTPVKRYSSGMRVRLAFAVAAHLDPEILIVDEVLSVGDIAFQKKCLKKMEDVGEEGRTVLFVSHHMSSVTRLCKRAILLEHGRAIADGPVHDVMSTYLHREGGAGGVREWVDPKTAPGTAAVRLRAVRAVTETGELVAAADIRRPLFVQMEFDVYEGGKKLKPYLLFYNEEGVCLFPTSDLDPEWRLRPRPAGRYVSTVQVPGNFLAEGTVFVGAGLDCQEPPQNLFFIHDVVAVQVVDSLDGDSARGDWGGNMRGVVRPLLEWKTQYSAGGEGRDAEEAAAAKLGVR